MIFVSGCSSGETTPNVKFRSGSGGIWELDQVVGRLKTACPNRSGNVRLDLRQGDARVRHVFSCDLVLTNGSRAEAEVADLVSARHNAARRADRVIRFDKALNVRVHTRLGLVWALGTGLDGVSCARAGDTVFHRGELAIVAPAGPNHESPTRWTEVEAAYIAGACPDRLQSLFSSVVRAGQPTAASAVRSELERLGIGI